MRASVCFPVQTETREQLILAQQYTLRNCAELNWVWLSYITHSFILSLSIRGIRAFILNYARWHAQTDINKIFAFWFGYGSYLAMAFGCCWFFHFISTILFGFQWRVIVGIRIGMRYQHAQTYTINITALQKMARNANISLIIFAELSHFS